jgi:hypothetical protein
VCSVSFDRGVILCDVCYLCVVSYCKPLPPDKNPFEVNKYYITLLSFTETSTELHDTLVITSAPYAVFSRFEIPNGDRVLSV